MSDRVGLLLKMLLPSVAISIAIHYFGTSLTLVPNTTIVLIAVFSPAVSLGLTLALLPRLRH
jgi:hypothetical protein